MAWTATLTGGIHPKFRGPLAVVDGPMGERIAEVPADPGQDPMPRARLIAAAPGMQAALEVVCEVLAMARDDEPLPKGWLEDLKYQVVDRAIEAAKPGFDGGTTTAAEVDKGIAAFRAALAKAVA